MGDLCTLAEIQEEKKLTVCLNSCAKLNTNLQMFDINKFCFETLFNSRLKSKFIKVMRDKDFAHIILKFEKFSYNDAYKLFVYIKNSLLQAENSNFDDLSHFFAWLNQTKIKSYHLLLRI